MNVLIVGGGGREHAIGSRLKSSPRCGRLYFCPGNAGTAEIGNNVSIDLTEIDTKTADAIGHFSRQNDIGLVVVGPEDPIAQGLTDRLREKGLRVFGPSKEAARLEWDKAWAKQVMRSAAIPTAEGRTFSDPDAAIGYVRNHETPLAVKAGGLASGKGSMVCDGPDDAEDAVRQIMIDRAFGEAGDHVVIEERLVGQEVSVQALVDGQNIYVLEPAQDHKQVGVGDTGPNTGGMGAYSPTPVIDQRRLQQIEREILVPTVAALRREGLDYTGLLYAGLMMTAGGPKVLEFNCRFGDPECQPLLVRLRGDLLAALEATCEGRLADVDLGWDERVACCVVIGSAGYPGSYRKGLPISGLEDVKDMEDVWVFHAGTRRQGEEVVTNGGRVLNVVALGKDLAAARARANEACGRIWFQGAFFRHDIGLRVLTQPSP